MKTLWSDFNPVNTTDKPIYTVYTEMLVVVFIFVLTSLTFYLYISFILDLNVPAGTSNFYNIIELLTDN